MTAEEIIRRCTRLGSTSWFNVAQQLGCSVDQARSRHDPNYRRPNPFAERQAQKAEQPINENDLSSPYVKGPPIRDRILTQLAKLPGTRQEISMRLAVDSNTIHAALSGMKSVGLVTYDGVPRGPCLWRLTDAGRQSLKTEQAA